MRGRGRHNQNKHMARADHEWKEMCLVHYLPKNKRHPHQTLNHCSAVIVVYYALYVCNIAPKDQRIFWLFHAKIVRWRAL